jgi:hypothetical protein
VNPAKVAPWSCTKLQHLCSMLHHAERCAAVYVYVYIYVTLFLSHLFFWLWKNVDWLDGFCLWLAKLFLVDNLMRSYNKCPFINVCLFIGAGWFFAKNGHSIGRYIQINILVSCTTFSMICIWGYWVSTFKCDLFLIFLYLLLSIAKYDNGLLNQVLMI